MDYLFFLGGYDAEMCEIRDLLLANEQTFFDKQLSWGAKASSYKNELAGLDKKIPVLIELEIDLELPQKAILIDHHGERAGENTSIEQVAELLGITLNHWQKLIAANDRGWFDGLKDAGATPEEIQKIRAFDKKCQGVTKKEEDAAQECLLNLECVNGIAIVKFPYEHTSPVADLLYDEYRNFLIYTKDSTNFTGDGSIVSELKEKFPKCWSGGNLPEREFWGTNAQIDSKEITALMPQRIYSQHVFLFPFTIEISEEKKKTLQKNKLQKFFERFKRMFKRDENENIATPKSKLEIIHDKLKDSFWEYKPFSIGKYPQPPKPNGKKTDVGKIDSIGLKELEDGIWSYNENNYFYDNVRNTLFNDADETDLFTGKPPVSLYPVSLYYERPVSTNSEMLIHIKNKENSRSFALNINHLSLRIFETGIGILTLTLYNHDTPAFADVLLINEYGRRIYPQFLGAPPDDLSDMKDYKSTNATKDAFLPDRIGYTIGKETGEEAFESGDFFQTKHKFAKYIEILLNPLKSDEVVPIIDDRMFTICWHQNNAKVAQLKKQGNDGYQYQNNSDWYKYIFLDGHTLNIKHKAFMNELIESSTYGRFIDGDKKDEGSLFGVSRYSFVCLTDDGFFPTNILRNHMQKMYYQMCILLLAQRASILQFNNELGEIVLKFTNQDRQQHEANKKTLEDLYIRYLNFQNRLAFDEVTAQEQGIELYQMALKNMNIPGMLSNLKDKLDHVHAYMDLKAEREEQANDRRISESVARLSLLGVVYLPATFIITLWSMKLYFLEDVYIKKSSYYFNNQWFEFLRNHFDWVNAGEFVLTSVLVLRITLNMMKELRKKFAKQPDVSLMKVLRASLWDWLVIPLIIILLAQIALFW